MSPTTSSTQSFDHQSRQNYINEQMEAMMCGDFFLHSGNIGNLSTAFRSEYDDNGDPDGGKSKKTKGKQHGKDMNWGVHLTQQVNFRTNGIPFSNQYIENYKLQNDEHFTHFLGANTIKSYPRFDGSKTTYRFPDSVTLFELNSQMESFLRERQILFRTALSRKLFFHRF